MSLVKRCQGVRVAAKGKETHGGVPCRISRTDRRGRCPAEEVEVAADSLSDLSATRDVVAGNNAARERVEEWLVSELPGVG